MSLRDRLRHAKSELRVLAVASRHPRTPWYAKALLLLVVAYAASPIDLIPDPIPVLGLLDDAILLPLGVALAWKMIPTDVMQECRLAPPASSSRSMRFLGATLVLVCWAASITIVLWLVR